MRSKCSQNLFFLRVGHLEDVKRSPELAATSSNSAGEI